MKRPFFAGLLVGSISVTNVLSGHLIARISSDDPTQNSMHRNFLKTNRPQYHRPWTAYLQSFTMKIDQKFIPGIIREEFMYGLISRALDGHERIE